MIYQHPHLRYHIEAGAFFDALKPFDNTVVIAIPHLSILSDIIMITPAGIAQIPMGGIYVFSRKISVYASGRTMNDNKFDGAKRSGLADDHHASSGIV